MDINILEVIKFIFSTIGVSSVIVGVINRRLTKRAKEKEDALLAKKKELEDKAKAQEEIIRLSQQASKVTMRTIIYDLCNEIKEQKYIWLYQLEQLDEAFTIYEALGGNGAAHKVYGEVKATYKVITSPDEI